MNLFHPKKQISIAPLIIFRLLFGVLTLFGTIRFLAYGWVSDLYIQPKFYFTYYGFDWVKTLPGDWMYLPFILMMFGSLGIILGLYYRFSSSLFFLSFTYIELLDKTNYLNHYYFVSLVAFLLIFVPAHKDFSLDVTWRKLKARTHIPLLYVQIFQFQLACVYVYAGIAKLNSDWLFNAQPLVIWLQSHRDLPLFGSLLSMKWVAYVFSWFGCFYDLFIVFFLLRSNTRWIAYTFVVLFHFLTGFLFPIGVFPYVMICLTLIFFSEGFHLKIISRLKRIFHYPSQETSTMSNEIISPFLKYGLILFITLQILIPFRSVLYPGELFWNEEGFRFSWRVMLMHKEGLAQFYIHDNKSGGEIEIMNSDYLTKRQEEQMSTQPDMLIQYAHYLKEEFEGKELRFGNQTFFIENPSVHADVYVTLNGRRAQKMIKKSVNLSSKKYNLKHRDWLEEFTP